MEDDIPFEKLPFSWALTGAVGLIEEPRTCELNGNDEFSIDGCDLPDLKSGFSKEHVDV